MSINGEVTVGSLLAALSVLVSATALTIGWRKDRELRRREYADRIRGAAGRIAAMLERWQLLVLGSFEEAQPLLIEVGRMAERGDDPAAARHAFLKGLYEHRAAVSRRVADERLEAAYVDLYGYDPRIHGLFLGAVERLKAADAEAFRRMRGLADDVLPLPGPAGGSAVASGDRLVAGSEEIAAGYREATGGVIDGFRAQMLRLILSDDEQVLGRRVAFAPPEEALPSVRLGTDRS